MNIIKIIKGFFLFKSNEKYTQKFLDNLFNNSQEDYSKGAFSRRINETDFQFRKRIKDNLHKIKGK